MTTDGDARGLSADCLIETAEGSVVMRDTPKKGFAVMTRMPDGVLGFRQLIRLEHREDVPLVRVSFDNGHSALLGRDHPVYKSGMAPVPAHALVPGDAVETAYQYPDGYTPTGMEDVPAAWGIRVTGVEAAGDGAVMFGTVRDTHHMFLTAGVLCGE